MKEGTKKSGIGRDLKRGLLANRGVLAGSAGLVGGYLVRKAKERRDRKRRMEKLKKALGGRKLIMIAVGKPSSDEKLQGHPQRLVGNKGHPHHIIPFKSATTLCVSSWKNRKAKAAA